MADTATDIARLTADAQANQQTVAQVVTLVGDLKNQVGTLQAGDVLTADQKAALEAALAQIEGTTQQAQGALPQTAPPAGDGSGGTPPAGDGSGGTPPAGDGSGGTPPAGDGSGGASGQTA